VWPLYGPVAGGTRVTITGQSLSLTTITAVYIGQYKACLDISRFSSFLALMMILGMIFVTYVFMIFLFR